MSDDRRGDDRRPQPLSLSRSCLICFTSVSGIALQARARKKAPFAFPPGASKLEPRFFFAVDGGVCGTVAIFCFALRVCHSHKEGANTQRTTTAKTPANRIRPLFRVRPGLTIADGGKEQGRGGKGKEETVCLISTSSKQIIRHAAPSVAKISHDGRAALRFSCVCAKGAF